MRAIMLLGVLATSACWHEQRDVRDARDVLVENENTETETTVTGTEAIATTETVKERSHAKGALQGLGLGVLIGGGLGAAAGFASGDDHDCDNAQFFCLDFTAKEKAVFAGIGGAAVGGIVGLVIGGIVGSETVVEHRTSRITPVGPQGSTAGFTLKF